MRLKATGKISNAHYKGEFASFGIGKHHSWHKEAHNLMVEAGTPLIEETKIKNFEHGILENNAKFYSNMAGTGIVPEVLTFSAW